MTRWTGLIAGMAFVVAVALVPSSGAVFTDQTNNAGNTLSAASTFDSIRITTYQLGTGVFGGTTYTLTLDQPLTSSYFVIMRGGAGNNTNSGNRGPDENFARVSGDPFGNFATTTASNALDLERGGTTGDWQGQVTVVEAIADFGASSFTLLDVVETTMGAGVTAASSSSAAPWTSIGQVGLYGGPYGGGTDSTNAANNSHQVGWAEIWPTGASTINLQRQAGGGGNLNGTSVFTTYVVEWGSEWTIQRAFVTGNNGGNGVNAAGEYDTAGISAVARNNTFVLGYGRTADNGLGDGFGGAIWTLGNGVTQNAVESTVAVGGEFTDTRNTVVYVHTHPDLRVDHRFGTDGGTGVPAGSLTGTITIDASIEPESYSSSGGVSVTGDSRMAVVSNTSNGTGNAYPRPFVFARPTASSTATWTRTRTGQPGAFWMQAIDFALIRP